MTICRLPVEGDMGKYLLKRTLWKIVITLSYIFLYIIILTPISIVVAGKFGSDSKEISIFYIGMSIGLLISFVFFIKWLSTSSIEENCVQYIFAITSSNDIWVINCYDPIISSSFKNSRPNIKANLGFYGTIFSFSMRTRYLVNNACKLSYASEFDIVGYFTDKYDKSTRSSFIGQPIYNVSNLKIHRNYIAFQAEHILNDPRKRKNKYKISRKFTDCDELIKVLKNLNSKNINAR